MMIKKCTGQLNKYLEWWDAAMLGVEMVNAGSNRWIHRHQLGRVIHSCHQPKDFAPSCSHRCPSRLARVLR